MIFVESAEWNGSSQEENDVILEYKQRSAFYSVITFYFQTRNLTESENALINYYSTKLAGNSAQFLVFCFSSLMIVFEVRFYISISLQIFLGEKNKYPWTTETYHTLQSNIPSTMHIDSLPSSTHDMKPSFKTTLLSHN